MNQVILCGRLVRDPEIRVTAGEKQTSIANFTLAVDRKFKRDGEPTADFINCTAFGKTAEILEKYVHQGNKIIVVGEWRTGSYKNKDGNKVYTNDCNVASVEFVESKNASGENANGGFGMPPMPSGNDDFMSIPDGVNDSGLPFN